MKVKHILEFCFGVFAGVSAFKGLPVNKKI